LLLHVTRFPPTQVQLSEVDFLPLLSPI